MNSADLKTSDVIVGIATQWKLHLGLFLLNFWYYQNEIWSETNALYETHF